MANKDPILSFEDFCHKRNRNNFDLHFAGRPKKHFMGDTYRKNLAFKACMKAHPKKFGNLARGLYGWEKRDERGKKEFLEKAYRAYVIMHPFAKSNWEMFQ